MDQAKRVILRLREAEQDEEDLYEPVRLYLEKNGRSVEELNSDRHFVHIQPSNPDIPQVDPKIHIIIDIEVDKFTGNHVNADFPHELYRVRRVDGQMTMFTFKNAVWYSNFLHKLRAITDEAYPWGMTTYDYRRGNSVETHTRTVSN
ncbi:predicted protein [Uncinocarpus reesii 1704]|uniref:Uncharacterized protein n=1 Tax=Uncinocarpus reesii (strain UAMH 1704) TaxID=336963 RepID=C4K027_UNCRE|nr:uncharacterized protein UREG_07778 [Uncinocarpus reesii 1704]EEP82913.1 predicted protein [Uncinocarpus reesii 1704]